MENKYVAPLTEGEFNTLQTKIYDNILANTDANGARWASPLINSDTGEYACSIANELHAYWYWIDDAMVQGEKDLIKTKSVLDALDPGWFPTGGTML